MPAAAGIVVHAAKPIRMLLEVAKNTATQRLRLECWELLLIEYQIMPFDRQQSSPINCYGLLLIYSMLRVPYS